MEVSFSTVGWNAPIEFMNAIGGVSTSPFAMKLTGFSTKNFGNSIAKVFVELLVIPEGKKLNARSKYISDRQMWNVSLALHLDKLPDSQGAANLYILDLVIEGLLKAGAQLKHIDFAHQPLHHCRR